MPFVLHNEEKGEGGLLYLHRHIITTFHIDNDDDNEDDNEDESYSHFQHHQHRAQKIIIKIDIFVMGSNQHA